MPWKKEKEKIETMKNWQEKRNIEIAINISWSILTKQSAFVELAGIQQDLFTRKRACVWALMYERITFCSKAPISIIILEINQS